MNKFLKYNRDFHNENLSLDIIQEFIDNFWVERMLDYSEDQVIHIIFKVEYADNSFRSFSNMSVITKNIRCKQVIYDSIKFYILNNLSHYTELQVKNIFFSYTLSNHNLKHDSHTNLRSFINSIQIEPLNEEDETKPFFKEYDFLPYTFGVTMFLSDWSPNIKFRNGHRIAYFLKDGYHFNFSIFSNYYVSTIEQASDNSIVLKFKDRLNIEGHSSLTKLLKSSENINLLNSFTRVIYRKGVDSLWNYEHIKYEYHESILIKTKERLIAEGLKLSKRFPKDKS